MLTPQSLSRSLCLVLALFVGTAAAEPPVIQPIGKDLSGWKYRGDKAKSKWMIGTAKLDKNDQTHLQVTSEGKELVNNAAHHGDGVDIYTAARHGDAVIEVEFMIPKGSNSGVYVMGEYEVQILDSVGKPDSALKPSDIGGLYGASPPRTNASKGHGEWQKFVIDFRAPKFDADGKKTANAKFVKVVLNDKVLHENVEMKGPTPTGVTGKEAPTGPLMLQGNHGAISYRNIKITPVK